MPSLTHPRLLAAVVGIALAGANCPQQIAAPSGMILIEGGEFMMGTDDAQAYPQERPARRVKLDSYYIDATEVTNEQFKAFVDATNYVTMAERIPDWEQLKLQVPPGTPKPPAESLVAGSVVFVAPTQRVNTADPSAWWQWIPGASWHHPEGPQSTLDGRWDHPVTQVSWEDAIAYAKWAGKRLPTEAEFEFAARGKLEGATYGWGNEFIPSGKRMANVWQGEFPNSNSKDDGFAGTAPVKSFPANGYGLYDTIGNVWEWCGDSYESPEHPRGAQRVIKGGSFLCAENYCRNYRPSARRGTDWDTGLSNLGFRCVKDLAAPSAAPGTAPAAPQSP